MTGNDPLEEALAAAGLNTVAGAFAYGGGQELAKPALGSRRRTRIELTDRTGRHHVLYLKRYGPEGLLARLRRYSRLFCYTLGPAGTEAANIARVRGMGIPTMQTVRWREEFDWMLGVARGYLVVQAVPGEALERCASTFLYRGGERAGSVLAEKLAELAGTLHRAGYVHRDLYASHIFLHESGGGIELYLIDLARMFAPRWRKFRWRVKDLAQLKFSMPRAWIAEHWDAFLRQYLERTGRRCPARYNRAVDCKVRAIARHSARQRARASARVSA